MGEYERMPRGDFAIKPLMLAVVLSVACAAVFWRTKATITTMEIPMNKTPNSAFKATPLHVAAQAGDLDACRKLLDEGADVNALDDFGWSPLILAVQNKHIDIARLLLESGAKMHYAYQREDTPDERRKILNEQQALSEQLKTRESMRELLKDLPDDLAEEISSEEMMAEMTQSMVDLHFEPTSHHVLEHCYDLEMLKVLVADYKADVNHVASDGTWPLANFAEIDDIEAVAWLLEHAADPNTTSTGETAIFKAIRNDNLEMVQLLLSRGAAIEAQDVDGWSVLFACASLEMAKHLIEKGADPTALDQAGFPCWNWIDDGQTRDYLKQEALKRGLKKWTALD